MREFIDKDRPVSLGYFEVVDSMSGEKVVKIKA
jgi:hypothetical protein